MARRPGRDLRPYAEGHRAGAGGTGDRLRAAEPCHYQRMDSRPGGSAGAFAHGELAPAAPPPRRDMAHPRDRLRTRHLLCLRAAGRRRLRLPATRDRTDPRRDHRGAAAGAPRRARERARLRHRTGPEDALPDPRTARQPLSADLERVDPSHRLCRRPADRLAGVGCRFVRLVRHRAGPPGHRHSLVGRGGARHRARRVGNPLGRD